MSDVEIRSKPPRLILTVLILTAAAVGVRFVFKKESSLLHGAVAAHLRGLFTDGTAEEQIPVTENISRTKDPEKKARALLMDAIWCEDTGDVKTAQKKYRECVKRYPNTKSARNAKKLLRFSLEDSNSHTSVQKPDNNAETITEDHKKPALKKKQGSKADQYYNRAISHMRKAYRHKPSAKRNREFRRAETLFRKAIAIWEIKNEGKYSSKIEVKLIKANEQLYSCLKYSTIQ